MECTKASIATGDQSNPKGNVRLVTGGVEQGTFPTVQYFTEGDGMGGHVDAEGTLTVDNFAVTNSQGLEPSRWDSNATSDADKALKGY